MADFENSRQTHFNLITKIMRKLVAKITFQVSIGYILFPLIIN